MTSSIDSNSFDDVEGRCSSMVADSLGPLLRNDSIDSSGEVCSRTDFENALCELIALESEERLLDMLTGTESSNRVSLAETSKGKIDAVITPAASLSRAAVMLEHDIGTSVQQLTAEAELCAVAAREYASSVQRLERMKNDIESGQHVHGSSVSVAVQTD